MAGMDLKMPGVVVELAVLAAVGMQGTVQAMCMLAAVAVCLQAMQVVVQWQHRVEAQYESRAAQHLVSGLQTSMHDDMQTLQTSVHDHMETLVKKVEWVAHSVDGVLTKVICSRLRSRNWW